VKAIDLIGSPVYDSDGQLVGTVNDLVFTADDGHRAPEDAGSPAYRVTALECGPIGLGHRLGYSRHRMAGPWPLPALFRLLAGRSVLVEWSDISRRDGGTIHLGRRRADLPSANEDDS
jgi:hypothetical protein